jgi:hypothetical protein
VHIILESHLKRVISFFHYISLSCVLITVCLCYLLDIWLLVRLMFNCNAGKKLKFMDVYGIYVDLHSPFRGCICYTGILPQLGVPMNFMHITDLICYGILADYDLLLRSYLSALISQSFLDIGSVSRILDSIMKLCLQFCWSIEQYETGANMFEIDHITEVLSHPTLSSFCKQIGR